MSNDNKQGGPTSERPLTYEAALRNFLEDAVSPELLPLPDDLEVFIDSQPGLRDFVNETFVYDAPTGKEAGRPDADEFPDALHETLGLESARRQWLKEATLSGEMDLPELEELDDGPDEDGDPDIGP